MVTETQTIAPPQKAVIAAGSYMELILIVSVQCFAEHAHQLLNLDENFKLLWVAGAVAVTLIFILLVVLVWTLETKQKCRRSSHPRRNGT